MTKQKIIFIAVLLALIFLALSFMPTGASDGLPSNVTVFEVGDHTCVLYSVTGGDKAVMECFCPCDGCSPEQVVTKPVKTEKPTDVPPTQIPPDTPEPTPKEKCNAGRGNGSEGNPDCDPGNSGKNQGGD